MHLYFYWDFNT